MRVGWSYCLAGIGVVALSTVIGLEVEIATARPGSVSSTIDRTLKGDRLDPDSLPNLRPTMAPAGQPKLPYGCESSVSTIHLSPVVGRCLAAAPAGTSAQG
jgi:hypothetical protein